MAKKKCVILGMSFLVVILMGVCSSFLCFRLGIRRASLLDAANSVYGYTAALGMMKSGKTDEAIQLLEKSVSRSLVALQIKTCVEPLESIRQGTISSLKSYVSEYDTQFSNQTLMFIEQL